MKNLKDALGTSIIFFLEFHTLARGHLEAIRSVESSLCLFFLASQLSFMTAPAQFKQKPCRTQSE